MTYAKAHLFCQAIFDPTGGLASLLPVGTLITVKNPDLSTATVYTDETATTTAANPVATDANKNLSFYVLPGNYKLAYATASGTKTVTVPVGPAVESIKVTEAPLSPARYGVLADGSTDDTAAWQAVANAVPASGGEILGHVGTSILTGVVTFSNRTNLLGRGQETTKFRTASATASALSFPASCSLVSGLTVLCTATTPTAGAGILLPGSGGGAALIAVDNVRADGFYDNISTENSYAWSMSRLYLINPARYGLLVRNTPNPDVGDSWLGAGSIFDAGTGIGVAAIRQESSGGLKISDTKVGHHAYGFDLAVADGVATSLLFLSPTVSFEGQTSAPVRLGRAGTTGTFTEIDVASQISANSAPVGVLVNAGISRARIRAFIKGTAGVSGTIAVNLAGGDGHQVEGCHFYNHLTCVQRGANVAGVTVGPNTYNVDNAGITNFFVDGSQPGSLAGSYIQHSYQADLGSITSSSTYSNFFAVTPISTEGVDVEIVISGIVQGVGAVQSRWRYAITGNGTSSATAVADGSAFHGFSAVDLQMDTSTVGGAVLIGVRRNSAGGGTAVAGEIRITLRGSVAKVGPHT